MSELEVSNGAANAVRGLTEGQADGGSKRLLREDRAWRNREDSARNTVCIMAQRKRAINH